MKICSKCGVAKQLEDFYKHNGAPDGRRGDCKACILGLRKARYEREGDVLRARVKAYQAANPASRPTLEAATLKGDAAVEKFRAKNRRNYLRTYGLTLESYAELFASQDHRCAICRSDEPGKSWCVDHDHTQGPTAVRGILCWHCNVALGHFRDDAASLIAAADYVLRFSRVEVA